MKYWTVFTLSVFFPLAVHALIDGNLIENYSQVKNVQVGTVFTCQSKRENFKLLKVFAFRNLRFLVVDVLNTTTVFENVLRREHHNLIVVIDGECSEFLEILTEKDKKYFYESYHWLFFASLAAKDGALTALSKLPLNINSDVNLAVKDSTLEIWTIFDVYNPAFNHSGQFIVTKLGSYTTQSTFPPKLQENKYWIRKNMSGVHFTSAVVVPDPSLDLEEYLTSQDNRQMHSMHRFQSVTVNYCKEMYNFSLKIKRTDSWGYLTPNGHFDGLVGLLERRLVDFGSSPLIYKLDRMPVVDYSYGNWRLKSTFIYRKPHIIEASYKIFMRPLDKTVWICIALMMGLLMLFLKLIFSREKRLLGRRNLVDSSWSFLFLFTLGAFCQQGATCHPQLFSSRTLSVFVFLFCILTYQFYSASIVSYLLMDPPRKINNLKDLLDSNLKPGIEDILIDRNYFVQTTDPVAIELFHTKLEKSNNNSGFYQPADGLRLVKRGGFAFHVETSTAYPIIEQTFTNQEICELEEVQMYRTQPMHTNLQKNSPFREMMNYCMLHIVENGLMFRLRKYWDARTPICIESAKKVTINVSLQEFSTGLIVLCYGVCLSLILLLIEIIIYRRMFTKILFVTQSVVYPYTQ